VLSSKTAKSLPTENFEPPSSEVQPGIQSTIPHSIVTSTDPPSIFSELLLAANPQPPSQFVESLPAENFQILCTIATSHEDTHPSAANHPPTTSLTQLPPITSFMDFMTFNRFEEMKRFLHVSDNSLHGNDEIKKIRPLVEKLRERYKTVSKEEHLSVDDEQIVPFKGRSCLGQYNPKKPHKWGYKLWVLCGATGFAYDFEVYTGKADNDMYDTEPDCGASGNVVIRMSR